MANGRGDPRKTSFRASFDDRSAVAALDRIAGASTSAVRVAAQAGAEELYLEARLFAPVSDGAHYFYGKQSKQTGVRYYFEAGNLRNAIYQAFSADNSGKGVATYHVSWNHRKAPYGYMVEFGTARAPAHSFIRRAFDSRKDIALQVARATLLDEMRKEL